MRMLGKPALEASFDIDAKASDTDEAEVMSQSYVETSDSEALP